MRWSGLMLVLMMVPAGCGGRATEVPAHSEITVAAAANLVPVFDEIGAAFTRKTGIGVTLSYASTAQLAQQIDNGAPFDVFAAADVAHVDELIRKGRLVAEGRSVYARGQLALWIPRGEETNVERLADLASSQIRFVAIASPRAAPYGQAAIEALRTSGLWSQVEPKVVFTSNINAAKQLAASGNADAAFTAYSLVLNEGGRVALIDAGLHTPIEQGIARVTASAKAEWAQRFIALVVGPEGRTALERYGYLMPEGPEKRTNSRR